MFNYRFYKNIFDKLFAALFILIFSPIFLFFCILVYLNDKNNPIYCGERVGKNGAVFNLYKIRSMTINSGKQLTTGLNDPRVTKVGNFIRKFKIDELPQLFNIIKGDMSFIGPRPEIYEYTDLYNDEEKMALTVLPGLSDLASLKYIKLDAYVGYEDPHRNYLDKVFKDKNRLRVQYAKSQSFVLDFKILLKTIFSVINSTLFWFYAK